MPDAAIAEIAKQAPYAAMFLIFTAANGWFMWRLIHNFNDRMEVSEKRHSIEREAQENRWIDRVENISVDCHATQAQATVAIERLADSNQGVARSMAAMSAKLDTAIQIARSTNSHG